MDLDNDDFSEDLENLFSNIPIVRQERTLQNVTSDYITDNIKENNISYYFKTIKEAVRKTISNFKGNSNTKFKIIITCEFTMPLPFDIVEGHFNRQFEELVTMNNFDDIYLNIEDEVMTGLDGYQQRGSGFVFESDN